MDRFRLQLKEHQYYAGNTPVVTFSKPTGGALKCESSVASIGAGYVFAVLPRAYSHGKQLSLTWETLSAYGSFIFRARIYDGAYDRTSATDFPAGSALATKGAGLLQTVEDLTGTNASHTETVTLDLSSAQEDSVTLLVHLIDGWSGASGSFTVTGVQLLDVDDTVLSEADLAAPLEMEQEGGTADYGLIGCGTVFYCAYRDAISRTPCHMVKLILDYCDETFGAGDCEATGAKCYNTWATCRDKENYNRTTKTYTFTSADCRPPFYTGERPYLTVLDWYPTEIKTDGFTTKARVKASFADEDDTDVGIDPYVADRSTVQGTFWKKLLARNPNYKRRAFEVYDGFLGLEEIDFQKRFRGTIDNITRRGQTVTVEAVDLLQTLADMEVPPELDCKLAVEINSSQTSITLNDVTDLDSSGVVRINDEIITYTAKNAVSNQLTGCSRGQFGTTADDHSENDAVQKCRHYTAQNPFDILKTEMLETDAGFSEDDIDTAAFAAAKDWPGGEIDFEAVVSEPTPLEELYFEIVTLLGCRSWVAEDLRITISRNVPNEGGRAYVSLSDAKNVVTGSASVDLNEGSRLTRVSLYWGYDHIGDREKVESYARLDLSIDADAESDDEYGDEQKKTIWCRWIHAGNDTEENLDIWVGEFIGRHLLTRRDALPLVTLDVERKNAHLPTGAYVKLSTDEFQETDGSDLEDAKFRVVRREEKGNVFTYRLERLPRRRACLIAPDGTADYDSATDAEKEYGFICDDYGEVDGDAGYFIY